MASLAPPPEPSVRHIMKALDRDPDRVVLHWPGGAVGAGQLARRIRGAAATLRRAGADATSTVALLTEPNSPDLLAVRYAVHLLGAAAVHIRSMNPRTDRSAFPVDIQAEVIRQAGATILVVDTGNAGRGRELAAAVTGLTAITELDPDGDEPRTAFAPDALAVLDFTSGSTNRPKMVRHTYGTRETLIRILAGGFPDGPPPVLLCVTPISHTAAPMVDAVLSAGGRLVLHAGFDAGAVLRDVPGRGVTDVYLAVPHLYRLLDHPDLTTTDLGSLRRVVYSGTPAAPARITRALAVFGDTLVQVYGMTETGGITALTGEDHRDPRLLGSVGRPFPWVRLEIRDPDTGVPVTRGRTGEIWVRSPTVMAGYHGTTDRTFAAGTVRTGDLGFFDRYGYLRLAGRVGNVIKSGGLKIHPDMVTRALLAHPAVQNAAVYGIRDRDYVETVHGAVELRRGHRCTTEELRAHVAAVLSPAHVPAGVAVWDALPLTGSGKPDLALLRTRKGRA